MSKLSATPIDDDSALDFDPESFDQTLPKSFDSIEEEQPKKSVSKKWIFLCICIFIEILIVVLLAVAPTLQLDTNTPHVGKLAAEPRNSSFHNNPPKSSPPYVQNDPTHQPHPQGVSPSTPPPPRDPVYIPPSSSPPHPDPRDSRPFYPPFNPPIFPPQQGPRTTNTPSLMNSQPSGPQIIGSFEDLGGGKDPWKTEQKRDKSFATPSLDKRNSILCKLGAGSDEKTKHCQSKFIAESIDLLFVICPIYSFGKRFDSLLYELHTNFQSYIRTIGMSFATFEAIKYGSNETYRLTRPDNEPFEMQGYYHNISYVRENLLNVAIQRLQVDWEYVAWIDAHQIFENSFWWEEAIYKSEHFKMVQLFADSLRLNAWNQTTLFRGGFFKTSFMQYDTDRVTVQIETGNAHMITRETYEKMGYIHDECFASGCDWAYTQAGLPPGTLHRLEPLWPHYNHTHQEWLHKVMPIVNGSRAYIPGNILHFDHKSTFSYGLLRDMVDRSNYNVTRDFHKDVNGVFYLSNLDLALNVERFYLNHY